MTDSRTHLLICKDGGVLGKVTSNEGNSFLQRILYWHNALDPSLLLASDAEIQKWQNVLETSEGNEKDDEKVAEGRRLVQVSVHPDIGRTLPFCFRPSAYLLLGSPLVVTTLMPHRGAMSAFISQLAFQSYSAGFTVMNRNLSVMTQNSLSQHPLYLSMSALYVACVGATPLYIVKKLKLRGPTTQNFISRILPTPLLALLGGLTVYLMRISEVVGGVQVLDREGNVVGVSPKAGKKAVRETAISRAFLCGVTALVPSLVRRSSHALHNPGLFNVLKLVIAALTFATMTPVSFGLFPLQGMIKREDLEDELKEKTSDAELFYHRGM
ncbi:sideroflexin-4 [Mantella aurantiaca]